MSWDPESEANGYKDIVHNLGYNPIVRAFADITSYYVNGIKQVPVRFYNRVYVEDIGMIDIVQFVYYEYLDENTIRFHAPLGMDIEVTIYFEPVKDTWYEQ